MYRIEIIANSSPDVHGFHDFITLFDHDGKKLNSSIGSTCPNITSINGKINWRHKYGWIAPGVYKIKTVIHPKFGRCCIINDGAEVPARLGNPNHNWQKILTELFIHAGGTGKNFRWRGSGGCPTVMNDHWKSFSEALPDGDGVLIIHDRVIN